MNFPLSGSAVIHAFTLSACSSGTEPGEPMPGISAPSLSASSASNGVVVKAMGAGTIDLSTAGAGDADFQFVAHRKADGTASGQFRQSRLRGDLLVEFEGQVTCVTTDPAFPGRARIGGVITENNSTDPAFLTANHQVGDDVWFRVQDGGNGNDAADASTTYGFKPTLVNTSAEYCALPFTGLPWWNPASIFPLKRGTIRVKD